MYQPTTPRSKLANIFNPQYGAFYERPQQFSPRGQMAVSPRGLLTGSTRPMSARPSVGGHPALSGRPMSAYPAYSKNAMSPRASSPRNMGVEVSAKLADWVVRQAEMREMISSAHQRTSVSVQHKREKEAIEARLTKQRKEAAEREATIQALLAQREKEERKAARLIARREAAERAQRPTSARPSTANRPSSPRHVLPMVPDSELRRVHVLVKHALNGRHGGQVRARQTNPPLSLCLSVSLSPCLSLFHHQRARVPASLTHRPPTPLSHRYQVRQTFRSLDRDGSGKIAPDEVVAALRDLNLDVPEHLLLHLVNVCDHGAIASPNHP